MAVLRSLFGTDAEMEHPRTRETTDALLEDVEKKIDRMSQSSERLTAFLPAGNLNEALQQITTRPRQ